MFCGVGVDEGRLADVDVGTETVVGAIEHRAPGGRVHAGARGGKFGIARAVEVDFVGELVDDHVVAALLHADIFPREDHRATRPGLAGEGLVGDVHHAILVGLFLAHAEFAGVDDHAHPARIDLESQVEHRQAGLHRDRQAHLVVEGEAPGAVHFLFGKEQGREILQPRRFFGAQTAQERQARDHA